MSQTSEILRDLTLYGVYNIRYGRRVGTVERIVTPRALFLGEFDKNKLGASKFIPKPPSDQGSLMSKYFGVGFLVYFPGPAVAQPRETGRSFFEVILCDPEKGLLKEKADGIITILPGSFTVTTIVSGTTVEAKKAFEKAYTIAVKTGLIDPTLMDRNPDGTPRPLSRTVVRSIHKGFTEIISVTP